MKILLCEDNQEIAELLIDQLRDFDFQVIHAQDGCKGMTLYDADNFDFVITDCHMPLKNGIEVCKHINGRTPTFMFTSDPMFYGKPDPELKIQRIYPKSEMRAMIRDLRLWREKQ